MNVSKQWLDEIEAYWASDEGRAYAEWFWSDDNSPRAAKEPPE